MRPSVTFSPVWNKILHGDAVTMSCDVEGTVTWYRNNERIHTGEAYTIRYARSGDSGDYQCGTSKQDISETVTLNVTRGPLVLQSPPYRHEGEDLSLRCHSGSKDFRGPIEFYRNNELIHSSASDSEIHLRNEGDETAVYRCTKQVLTAGYSIYSDKTNVSAPGAAPIQVTFTPNWRKILTGESVRMTCDGDHSGTYHWVRDNTSLKQTDQNFHIRSAQRSDSGTYRCGTSYERNPGVRLDVSDDPVILQAPLHVSGKQTPHLRCHSRPEYSVDWTRFYKGDKLLQDSGDDNFYLKQAQVTGRYRCEKRLYRDPVSYTDSVSVPIREKERRESNIYRKLTVSIVVLLILIVLGVLTFRHRYQITRLFNKRNQTRDPQPVSSSAKNSSIDGSTYMEVELSQKDLTEADDVCYTTLRLPTKALSHKVTETVVYSEVRIKVRDS